MKEDPNLNFLGIISLILKVSRDSIPPQQLRTTKNIKFPKKNKARTSLNLLELFRKDSNDTSYLKSFH
jgi:hypothetical protein